MNPQVQSYISQRRQAGITDEQIKQELRTSGWAEADIAAGFAPVATVHHRNVWPWIAGLMVIALLLGVGGYAVFHKADNTPQHTASYTTVPASQTSTAASVTAKPGASTASSLCDQLSSSEQQTVFGNATIIRGQVASVPATAGTYTQFCTFIYLIKAGQAQIQFTGVVGQCAKAEVCDTYRKIIATTLQYSGAQSLGVGDVNSYAITAGAGGTITDSTGLAVYTDGHLINAKLAQSSKNVDAAYNLSVAQAFTKVIQTRF